MQKTITEIFEEMKKIDGNIKQILKHSEYEYADDLSSVIFDYKDAEHLFLVDEMRSILQKLCGISHTMNYLDRPIIAEGILHKNSYGRYEIPEHEFTSGNGIEYLATDDLHCRYDEETGEYINVPYWCASRVEHNQTDYYIVGAEDIELEGLRVRIR